MLDFGLAKVTEVPPSEPQSRMDTRFVSSAGALIGTIEYMSPEQALGRAVDRRSDIFSLGVVLYQLATARLPFEGSSPTETIARILDGVTHDDAADCRNALSAAHGAVADSLATTGGTDREADPAYYGQNGPLIAMMLSMCARNAAPQSWCTAARTASAKLPR